MSRRWIAALVLAAVSASWGTIPLIVRDVDLPAEQLVAARLWLGALPLFGWILVRGNYHLPRADRFRVFALGVVLAVHWAAFFWSLKTTTVAIALVLVYLAPILVAALAPRLLGEDGDLKTWMSVGMALVGVILVARPGAGATAEGTVAGFIAAATLAALILIGKPLAQSLGGLRLATYEHSIAALVMTPWAIATLMDVPWEEAGNASAISDWWQLLILGVVLTGITGALYWFTVAQLPVAAVGVIMYVEPAFAVVWAALFLQEVPDIAATLGVALVIAAGMVVALDQRR